jgi:hypothetical protein
MWALFILIITASGIATSEVIYFPNQIGLHDSAAKYGEGITKRRVILSVALCANRQPGAPDAFANDTEIGREIGRWCCNFCKMPLRAWRASVFYRTGTASTPLQGLF